MTPTTIAAAFRRVADLIPGDMLLNPPATEADLAAAEQRLGQELPDDVRALYLLHDGQHQYSFDDQRFAYGLFAEGALLPLADVVSNWEGYALLGDDPELRFRTTSSPEGFIRDRYFDRGWVPLTEDGGGNYIGVDLAPGPNGTAGQVISYGRDDTEHQVIAPSLTAYLEQLAGLLEQGYGESGAGIDEDGPGWHLRGSRGWLSAEHFIPVEAASDRTTPPTAPAADLATRFADGVEQARAERASGVRRRWTRGDRLIAGGVIVAVLAIIAVVLAVVIGVPSMFVTAAQKDHAYATGEKVVGTPTGNVCKYVARGSKVSVTKYAAQYRYDVDGKTYTVRGLLGTDQPTSVPVTDTTTVRYLPGHPDRAEADDRNHRDQVSGILHRTPKVVTGDDCTSRGEPA